MPFLATLRPGQRACQTGKIRASQWFLQQQFALAAICSTLQWQHLAVADLQQQYGLQYDLQPADLQHHSQLTCGIRISRFAWLICLAFLHWLGL